MQTIIQRGYLAPQIEVNEFGVEEGFQLSGTTQDITTNKTVIGWDDEE